MLLQQLLSQVNGDLSPTNEDNMPQLTVFIYQNTPTNTHSLSHPIHSHTHSTIPKIYSTCKISHN